MLHVIVHIYLLKLWSICSFMTTQNNKIYSKNLPFFEEQAELFKALSHPDRLFILELLVEKGVCVKDLNEKLPISQPRLSQHINILKKANLIGMHINGPLRCYYVLRPTLVKGLMKLISKDHKVKYRKREIVIKEALCE